MLCLAEWECEVVVIMTSLQCIAIARNIKTEDNNAMQLIISCAHKFYRNFIAMYYVSCALSIRLSRMNNFVHCHISKTFGKDLSYDHRHVPLRAMSLTFKMCIINLPEHFL